jgi:hypothetical protein
MRSPTGDCRSRVEKFLAQRSHFEPEAVCVANEAAGLDVLPEPLVARSVLSRSAVVMVKLRASFMAARIAERSVPFPRWRRL